MYILRCRFIKDMSVVLSGGIFMQLLCAQMFIALSFLQVDMVKSQFPISRERKMTDFQAWGKFDPSLLIAGFCSFFSASNAFSYCYYGSNTTDQFKEASDSIYASNWYKLRINDQKTFLMMLVFAQKERNLTGFGFFRCTLDNFQKVVEAFAVSQLGASSSAPHILDHQRCGLFFPDVQKPIITLS